MNMRYVLVVVSIIGMQCGSAQAAAPTRPVKLKSDEQLSIGSNRAGDLAGRDMPMPKRCSGAPFKEMHSQALICAHERAIVECLVAGMSAVAAYKEMQQLPSCSREKVLGVFAKRAGKYSPESLIRKTVKELRSLMRKK